MVLLVAERIVRAWDMYEMLLFVRVVHVQMTENNKMRVSEESPLTSQVIAVVASATMIMSLHRRRVGHGAAVTMPTTKKRRRQEVR